MATTTTSAAAALLTLSLAWGAFAAPSDPASTHAPATARAAHQAAQPVDWDDLMAPADELLARHDCLACHAPQSELRTALDPRKAPVVNRIAERMSIPWIESFLEDPRGQRPGTHHPHQLAGLADDERAAVAGDLVHFLAQASGKEVAPIEPFETDAQTLELGRVLFHAVGCVACHGPLESVDELSVSLAERELIDWEDEEEPEPQAVRPGVLTPRLTALPPDLSTKYGPVQLAAFLLSPVVQRPSGHCPSMSLQRPEAVAIASYLLRDQATGVDGRQERAAGLRYRTYTLESKGDGAFVAMATKNPASSGVTTEIGVGLRPRDNNFGLSFSGWIEVPDDGTYTFHLTSDDGSRMHLDGELLVDNGGVHGKRTVSEEVELSFGLHSIQVQMYEVTGGEVLSLEWEGPGIERGPIPAEALTHWPLVLSPRAPDGTVAGVQDSFTVDAERAARGAEAFTRFGCVTCHDAPGALGGEPPAAPSLEQLSGVRPGVLVCLRPDGRYDFDDRDVGLLLAAFVEGGTPSSVRRSPKAEVEHTLARRNCYACHRRDDIGGVHPDLAPYYRGDEGAELGDQGRFPPVLTAVGRKLKPAVLANAVAGNEKVRPYLMTRMPRMGKQNLERLTVALMAADEAPTEEPRLADMCPPGAVDEGRRLAGDRGGLGCVQCHDFRGTASLGVRAVDMGTMHRRLRFGWFRELLLDPSNVDLDGRMANLWVDGASPVTDIAGGDREEQIRRLWCWLGEGPDSMGPPPGLDTGPWAYELTPDGGPRLVSVFMKDVSPRVLCVGTPEGVNMAFDVEHGRLAKLWRGRFMNVIGTWRGRAGALESPGSDDHVDLPGGTAIGTRPRLASEWDELAVGRSLGRSVGKDGSVTFRYEVEGLEVTETLRPTLMGVRLSVDAEYERRPGVERTFELRRRGGGKAEPVIARVGVARRFERAGRGLWRTSGAEWPLYIVGDEGVAVAEVIRPEPVERPASGKGRTSVLDARDREISGDRKNRRKSGSDLPADVEELRIPVLMAPAKDGSGDLVGRISWKYAW